MALAGATLVGGWIGLVAASPAAELPPSVSLCVTRFAPYVSYELPDGGRLTVLATQAFTRAGLSVKQITAPWARALQLATQGQCVLLTVWRTPERDAVLHYSAPVARMELGLFIRNDPEKALPAGARVAHERGSYLPPALTDNPYQLQPISAVRQGLQMLVIGRVDAVFAERASTESLLAQDETLARQVRWQGSPLDVKTTHMAVGRAHPAAEALMSLIDAELERSAAAR